MTRRQEFLRDYILECVKDGALSRGSLNKAGVLKLIYDDIGTVVAQIGLTFLGAKLSGIAQTLAAGGRNSK